MKLYLITTRSSASPLTLADRLVLSLVIYRNRVRQGATLYYVRKHSKINFYKCRGILKRLAEYNLVMPNGQGQYVALEPEGDRREWFAWRDEGDKWTRRLRYTPIRFGEMKLPLASEVLFHILCSFASRGRVKTTTRRLAKTISVSRPTVKRALERLASNGLIEFKTNKKGIEFKLIDKPVEVVKVEAVKPPTSVDDIAKLMGNYYREEVAKPGCHHRRGWWRREESQEVEQVNRVWAATLLGTPWNLWRVQRIAWTCEECKVKPKIEVSIFGKGPHDHWRYVLDLD